MAGERLWKSRSVETPKQGFHCAWKSRKGRGIPTFPQPRRRRSIDLKPDISCATKTGHFNLLTTCPVSSTDLVRSQVQRTVRECLPGNKSALDADFFNTISCSAIKIRGSHCINSA